MDPDAAFDLEIAAVVAVALLIVVVAVVASGGACEGDTAATRRADVENALGAISLTTYGQAAKKKVVEEEEDRCAICLSEYAKADELVRVLPACGHFFHAECDVDRWLRAGGTCPVCRGRLWPPPPPPPRMPRPDRPPLPRMPRPDRSPMPPPLPRMPRPECPPMRPPRRPSQ